MNRKAKLFFIILPLSIILSYPVYSDITGTNYRALGNSINGGGPVTGLVSDNYLLNSAIGLLVSSELIGSTYKDYSELMNVMYQPGSITTLVAIPGDYPGQINLTWTSPWRDDGPGTSSGTYVVRYSSICNFNDEFSFESSINTMTWVTNIPVPAPPFTLQSFALTGLTRGSTYYIAIKVIDGAGNQSRLSNIDFSSNTTSAQTSVLSIYVSPLSLAATVQADQDWNINSEGIVIVSSSNVTVKYELSCSSWSDPGNWIVTGSTPVNSQQFRFMGLFNSTLPGSTDFDVNLDTITEIPQTASANYYNGDQSGINISSCPVNNPGSVPVSNRTRNMWLNFSAPRSTPGPVNASSRSLGITITVKEQ
jgi:hypothetical protein